MNKSKRIAFSGLVTALSLIALSLSGIFPYAEYTCPALSGILLISIVIEINKRTALLAYFAVSLLGFFIVPNKEAVLLFIALLGYYPIIKSRLEQVKSVITEWILKIVLFNSAAVIAYAAVIYIFKLDEILKAFGELGQYGALIFLALGNVAFVLYDIAITRLIWFYIHKIKPKLSSLGRNR